MKALTVVVWKWKSNDTLDEPFTQITRKHWDMYGYWSTNREYYLRPGNCYPPLLRHRDRALIYAEVIESYFYAYRLTGNKTYQDWAWQAYEHINAVTRAPYGNSAVRDVLTGGGWYQSDDQESFWLAETLKYLYLIFDDPERVSLDEWVFNTEAHPLRRGRNVEW